MKTTLGRVPFLVSTLVLAIGGSASSSPARAQDNTPVLTLVEQVRHLKADQAKLGFHVHLRAVVTYFEPSEPDLFIQDSTGGIWVDLVGTQLTASSGDFLY